MAGDFSGLLGGIIKTIAGIVDYVKWFGKDDPKRDRGGARKNLEFAGNSLRKGSGVVSSIGGNFKSATKLSYQIAERGQQTSKFGGQVANAGGAIPGIQLVVAVMKAIKHGYSLARILMRRANITDRLKQLCAKAGDVKTAEAVEAVHGTLAKRTNRIGINLGHALVAITAGAFNVSGVGLAVGMVLNIASSALKFAQIAVRMIKQKARNVKAKKRAKKGNTKLIINGSKKSVRPPQRRQGGGIFQSAWGFYQHRGHVEPGQIQ